MGAESDAGEHRYVRSVPPSLGATPVASSVDLTAPEVVGGRSREGGGGGRRRKALRDSSRSSSQLWLTAGQPTEGAGVDGGSGWEGETRRCWAEPAAICPVGGGEMAKGSLKVYIQVLHVAPLEVTVSFASAPWLPEGSRRAAACGLLGAAGIVLQRRMIALADVEGAVVRLGGLHLTHPLGSLSALKGRVTRHYVRQVLQVVYKVLGSADFLGNPMGFLASLGSGMWDFVATPATSLAQRRPQAVVQGMAAGTASLLANTVFAFSNAASKMTGAAAKGVAALALDHEYIAEMERRQQEVGAQQWVGVWGAVLEGLTGVLDLPVRGLEKGGIPGMISGTRVDSFC